jgi:hypothetical protein
MPTAPSTATASEFPRTRGPLAALQVRMAATLMAVAGAALMGFAAWLEPSPTGVGTHTSFGMPSCLWMTSMNLPCPTCGMTTSFAHAADGHLFMAFRAQPAGALLALAVGMAAVGAGYVAITGARLDRMLAGAWRPRWIWAVGVVVILAWLYKMLLVRGLL